MIFVMIKLFRL